MTDREGWELCDCGRHDAWYNPDKYTSCYQCFLTRRADYLDCILCGRRWHAPEYATCYQCRGKRDDAARDLRLLILHRDDYRCGECESYLQLQVDHIKPCAKGGTADPWNLQVLCGSCNAEKGADWQLDGHWDRIRQNLIRDYFMTGRDLLDPDQQERLQDEVADWRTGHGHDQAVRWGGDWSHDETFDRMERILESTGDPISHGE